MARDTELRPQGFLGDLDRMMATLTDLVVVIDGSGTIAYINAFGAGLMGFDRAQVTGTPVTDWIHPDDLERTIIGISHAVDEDSEVPVTPAFYRLRRADGSWCRIEVNASPLRDDDGNELVLAMGRYSGDHDLQDRVLELLVGQVATDEAIGLVPEFGLWRHEGVDYAVFYLDESGNPSAAGSELLVALGGLERPDTPWAEIAASGHDRTASIEDLAASYAEPARAATVTEVCGVAVTDPLHDTHAVVAYARRDGVGAAPQVHGYALAVMAKALELILQWRYQVVALQRAARRDPLTGLANRTELWELLERAAIDRRAGAVGVLYIDLDGFKAVNDGHGHGVGDRVLAEVAQRLAQAVRAGDIVARLGGDEFAVVAFDLHDDDAATEIADRIVKALAEPFHVADALASLGASVGIAVTRETTIDPDAIIARADAALYQAKHHGRGRWFLASV